MQKKLEIKKRNLAELKADVQSIKAQIEDVSVQVSNATKDNSTLKKISENRESEISSLNITLNELEKTNQLQAEEY